jgi:predicted transglutaminase-like cysteine proteinase
MIAALRPLLVAGALLIVTHPPHLYSPQELAEWAKCSPEKMADYLQARITYAKQDKWLPAEVVMTRGTGDCKGFSIVTKDTLNRCAGFEARIVIKDGKEPGKKHAIVVFTDHKGRQGIFDNGRFEVQSRRRKMG